MVYVLYWIPHFSLSGPVINHHFHLLLLGSLALFSEKHKPKSKVVISFLWKTQNTEFIESTQRYFATRMEESLSVKRVLEVIWVSILIFQWRNLRLQRLYNISTAKESVNPLPFTSRAIGSKWWKTQKMNSFPSLGFYQILKGWKKNYIYFIVKLCLIIYVFAFEPCLMGLFVSKREIHQVS